MQPRAPSQECRWAELGNRGGVSAVSRHFPYFHSFLRSHRFRTLVTVLSCCSPITSPFVLVGLLVYHLLYASFVFLFFIYETGCFLEPSLAIQEALSVVRAEHWLMRSPLA